MVHKPEAWLHALGELKLYAKQERQTESGDSIKLSFWNQKNSEGSLWRQHGVVENTLSHEPEVWLPAWFLPTT